MVHNIKSLPILADRYSCTGCLACVDTCPVGALKTIIDEEGFLTYSLNVKVCISCHKCESNCPIVSEYKYGENVIRSNIYAAWNLCDAERMQSASGGAFSAIASYFLSQSNTCVIGATQDGIKTRHIAITQKKDLYKIQGSKYAQSDTTGIYKLTYDKLKAGVKVLFSGTPCQVAGILSYIKSQDLINNLYTIDIVCGGVPSLFLIKNFVDNNPLGVSRIVSYRDKRTGWKSKGYKYRLVYEDKNFILHEENDKNLVIDGFSSGLANRYACNNCRFSYVERNSDFTIADFVADLRAPTPSAAAELAVPNISDVLYQITTYQNRYRVALKRKLELMKLRYEKCMARRVFKEPLQKINEKSISLDMLVKSIENSINQKVTKARAESIKLIAKLDALSPLKTLARGYSIVEKDGKIVSNIDETNVDDILELRLKNGKLKTKVVEKIKI